MKVNTHQKKWNEKYDLLVEYKKEHGHCNVPTKDIFNGQYLGIWVDKQRGFYKKGKLLHDRLVRLNEIGFNWARAYASWEERFKQLEEFNGEHGHCNVPQKYLGTTKLLGQWVNEQRKRYRGKKLRKDRIDSLNGIGFTWEVRRDRRPARVGSEDAEQSDADARNDAPIDGEGRVIDETEAPTAKNTTRGTDETNDENEPPERPDSQLASEGSVRAKEGTTKRNASSFNTKEDLQAHGRRKKAKRSAIHESGAIATRSEGALKSSESTTTAAATTAQAAQGPQRKQVRQATAKKKKGGGKNIVGGKKKAPAKQESRDASDDDEDDEKKMPPAKYEAQCRGTVDDISESNKASIANDPNDDVGVMERKSSVAARVGNSTAYADKEGGNNEHSLNGDDGSQFYSSGEDDIVNDNNESNWDNNTIVQNEGIDNIMECEPSAESTADGTTLAAGTTPAIAAELERFKAGADEHSAQKLSEMRKHLKASYEDGLMRAREEMEETHKEEIERKLSMMKRDHSQQIETHNKDTEQMLVDVAISGYRDVEKLKASHEEAREQYKAEVECATRELKESHRKEMEQQQSEMMAAHSQQLGSIARGVEEFFNRASFRGIPLFR